MGNYQEWRNGKDRLKRDTMQWNFYGNAAVYCYNVFGNKRKI